MTSKPGIRPLRESCNSHVTLDGSIAELDSADPMVIQNPKAFVHHHTYGGLSRFFQGLAQGKLLGTRNPNPGAPEKRIWLPPRVYLPVVFRAPGASPVRKTPVPGTGLRVFEPSATWPGIPPGLRSGVEAMRWAGFPPPRE